MDKNWRKARLSCFVSHETGLEDKPLVSVSQVEKDDLDFQDNNWVLF